MRTIQTVGKAVGKVAKREIPFATFQTAFRYISQKSTKFLPINEVEI